MFSNSKRIADSMHTVEGLAAVVPSSSTPDYISLKNALAVEVHVYVKNATTVTGSAITLKQATAVAGTSEKALSFTRYLSNIDTATSDVMTESTATSDTFTTDATNSKNQIYKIWVDPASLDTNNGFDCIRAGTGNATAATVAVYYHIIPKNGGLPAAVTSFIID
jgi:hypothetical protein